MSGLLHMWVARHTFRRGYLRTLLFFLTQSLMIEAQNLRRTKFPSLPKWALILETVGMFLPSLYLYGGLFVESFPEWAENNPIEPPQWAKGVVRTLAEKLQIKLLDIEKASG
mmetsp:Transcript_22543/g.31535  ORF Transcript_22543/g.31535 Transcript_22543/m.31535 type:complete len:112 (+) Transcript_22543:62-397(+)